MLSTASRSGRCRRTATPSSQTGSGRSFPASTTFPSATSMRSRPTRGREGVPVFMGEPIQGKGVNLPPEGYLEGAQALCRRYGTLFCVDEVQTGFGRTGTMFAFEHWGLEPDLVPVAKSLSGGYVPVGALLMSRAVHEAVFDSMDHSFSHGSTFAPNELG